MDKTRFIYYNRRYYPCHIVVFVVRLVTGAVAPTAPPANISILPTRPVAFTAVRRATARVAAIAPPASTSTAMATISAPIAARLVMFLAAAIARQGNTSIRACDEPCLA